jgi:hypothetical protein
MGLGDWFRRRKKPAPARSPLDGIQAAQDVQNAVSRQIMSALAERGFLTEESSEALFGRAGNPIIETFRMKIPDGANVEEAKRAITEIMGGITADETRPGIRPPYDGPAEAMTWDTWRACMTEMGHIPGWAPARFCNRLGADQRTGWVFGHAKGNFGVWTQLYPVCRHPMTEGADTDEDDDDAILAAVTHLPTGMGIGVFHDRQTACAACDILEPLVDWHLAPEVDGTEENRLRWRELMCRSTQALEFNGITWSMNWHAHNGPGGPEIGIWTRSTEALTANKPEKVS